MSFFHRTFPVANSTPTICPLATGKQFAIEPDIAARDKNQIAGDRRAAPRIQIERRLPHRRAVVGVQAFHHALAALVVIEIRGGGDDPISHHVHGGVNVPFVVTLLPE